MRNSRLVPGLLGGTLLLILIGAAVVLWSLNTEPTRQSTAGTDMGENSATTPSEEPTQARTNRETDHAPEETRAKPATDAEPAPITAPSAPSAAPQGDEAEKDDLPPPIATHPRPAMEGEDMVNNPPSYPMPDLSGQALQVHRDLELTMRALHALLR